MYCVGSYYNKNKITPQDEAALRLFESKEKEYHLDEGGLNARYEAAKRLTEDWFSNTPYIVLVDTYCVGCTCSNLYKKEPGDTCSY